MTRSTGAAIAVVGVVLLVVARPFGPIGLVVALAAVLCGGLLAVAAPARQRPAATETSPPARTLARSVQEQWNRAIDHHNQVLGAYAAFELDPRMLLQFPALWDLSAPEVIAFHDSLETAGELRTDAYPGSSHAERYLAAVTDLRSAWASADRFARSTGTDALGPDDARDCRRALKLLNHADAAESAERVTYLRQVLGTVDRLAERGVVRRPERARERLETTLRRAIEA